MRLGSPGEPDAARQGRVVGGERGAGDCGSRKRLGGAGSRSLPKGQLPPV